MEKYKVIYNLRGSTTIFNGFMRSRILQIEDFVALLSLTLSD